MSAVIARAAVAPLYREPSLRVEQVSQLVLGETAVVLAEQDTWLRVRADGDRYEGWLHRGYAVECDPASAARWREAADGWSEGAVVDTSAGRRWLPLRARAALEHGRIRLPDGTVGALAEGHIAPSAEVVRAARGVAPERWAARAFAGARYEWGGVTDLGVDCSGLVQTTFAARGVALPRDSAAQAEAGVPIPLEAVRPGDLLFFSEHGRGVTHVAFAAAGDALVHSTVAMGGVVEEPWTPGHRAAQLRAQFVGARRVADGGAA